MAELLKNISISIDQQGFAHFANTLSMWVAPPWSNRSGKLEQAADGSLSRAFSYNGGMMASSTVYLVHRNGTARIGNIVPMVGRLTVREYNSVFDEFYLRFINRYALAHPLQFVLSKTEGNMSELLSPAALASLTQFSAFANKGSAATHPEDRRRWNAFMIQVHRDSTMLGADLLWRWLTEDMRWPESIAQELASEYESTRNLLTQYDQLG